MSDVVKVPLSDLVFSEQDYPRVKVDEYNIRQLEQAMEGNIPLPPILVAKGSNIIVDGVHRYHAHLRRGHNKISAIIKHYKTHAELIRESVMLNTGIGLRLGQQDAIKVIQIAERLGIKELETAAMLRTSIAHLRALKPRYVTVDDAVEGVRQLRRIPLKGSLRHLAGQNITAEQAAAMARAPGTGYLLAVNQLIDALNFDLLPPEKTHPALWNALQRLAGKILDKTQGEIAA